MAMTAVERWTAQFDPAEAQFTRAFGPREDLGDPSGAAWRPYWQDPRRELDTDVATIASYVQPEDVVIDVGGGPGRVGLPLALRCREVINVDPSRGAQTVFDESATQAGITNARFVLADWLAAEEMEGDVTIAVDMIYFERDIVPFIKKLVAASRRRVIIQAGNFRTYGNPKLLRVLRGEEREVYPGYPELLPVLWEMDILPDVRVVPLWFWPVIIAPAVETREEAVQQVLQREQQYGGLSSPEDQARARGLIEADFDEYFEHTPEGIRWRSWGDVRHLLITWETGGQS